MQHQKEKVTAWATCLNAVQSQTKAVQGFDEVNRESGLDVALLKPSNLLGDSPLKLVFDFV
ncbi:MAG TPA: hypothetical protein VK169_11005 [Saprospiraceae bacterium]|nr:hypothetical protein [Saprospiraceae bacterium]